MPWKINEVDAEIHAFDASALLTDEVVAILSARVSEAIDKRRSESEGRARDAAVGSNRRARD